MAPGFDRREPNGRVGRRSGVSATPSPPPFDLDGPLVYSLDRRGPNDPKIGSVHVVLALLTAALATVAMLVV